MQLIAPAQVIKLTASRRRHLKKGRFIEFAV